MPTSATIARWEATAFWRMEPRWRATSRLKTIATLGALSAAHQYCRIGRYAFVGGGSIIIQDVLPFSLTSAKRDAHAFGLNRVGLQRRGFSAEQMRDLHHAYKTLRGAKLNTTQAVEKLKAEESASEDVRYLIDFIESSTRGVLK